MKPGPIPIQIPYSVSPLPPPTPPHLRSGAGRVEAGGQAASHRREPAAEEEGGDGADAADAAGAQHGGVGPHPQGDRGPPAHQRPGLQLEAEAQVPGGPFTLRPKM